MSLDVLIRRKLGLLLAVAAGLAVLNLAVYLMAVSRLDHYARDTRRQVESNRRELKTLEDKERTLTLLVHRVDNDRKVMDELARQVFRTRPQRFVELQTGLKSLIDAHQLQLDNYSYGYEFIPSPDKKEGWSHRYIRVRMTLPLTGPYQEIKAFIRALQESPLFFTVDALSLSSSPQSAGTIRVNVAVSTYFVATPEDFPPKEAKS
jgi:Tfp pilus assembly protein PilO